MKIFNKLEAAFLQSNLPENYKLTQVHENQGFEKFEKHELFKITRDQSNLPMQAGRQRRYFS